MAKKYLTKQNGKNVLVEFKTTSSGVGSAGDLVALNEIGQLDSSYLPSYEKNIIIVNDAAVRRYPLTFTPTHKSDFVTWCGQVLTNGDDYIIDGSDLVILDAFPLEASDAIGESKIVVMALPLAGTGPMGVATVIRYLVFLVPYQMLRQGLIPILSQCPFKGTLKNVNITVFNPTTTQDIKLEVATYDPITRDHNVISSIVLPAGNTTVNKSLATSILSNTSVVLNMLETVTESPGSVTVTIAVQLD